MKQFVKVFLICGVLAVVGGECAGLVKFFKKGPSWRDRLEEAINNQNMVEFNKLIKNNKNKLLEQKFKVGFGGYVRSFPVLHYALRMNKHGIVKALINRGFFEVDDRTSNENLSLTPLHIAVFDGNEEMVKFFLTSGSYVNAQDGRGYTPLHYAVKNLHVLIAARLLKKGADAEIEDDLDKSAYNFVSEALRWKRFGGMHGQKESSVVGSPESKLFALIRMPVNTLKDLPVDDDDTEELHKTIEAKWNELEKNRLEKKKEEEELFK